MLKVCSHRKDDGFYEVAIAMEEGQPPSFLLRAVKDIKGEYKAVVREALTPQCRMIASGTTSYYKPTAALVAALGKLDAYLKLKTLEVEDITLPNMEQHSE